MNPIEIAANGVTALSIVLAGRNSIHTWWTGIVGCFLFAILFHGANLYAEVALQAFFILTSALGWWSWLHGRRGALPVTHMARRSLLWIVPAALLATAAYGQVLHRFTDAYAPFLDSAVLCLSVVAQLLLMQRRVETWMFWLAVNSIAVPLYVSRELHLTAALYGAFWINAMVSSLHWRRLATKGAG